MSKNRFDYFGGSKPPECIREDPKTKYEQSERTRKFLESWQKEFSWVEKFKVSDKYSTEVIRVSFDGYPNEVAMICHPCRDMYYAKRNLDNSFLPLEKNFKEHPLVFGTHCFR